MKDRDTIYLIERGAIQTNATVIIAAFGDVVAAYDKADAYTQEFKDRGLEDFFFRVIATTYYEE